MRKYLAIVKLSFQEALFYRANFFFYFLNQTLWFLTEILFWGAALPKGIIFQGFDFWSIFQYLLIIYLVKIMTVTGIDNYLGESIRSGKLSNRLLQPVSVFWAAFFHQYGRKIYRLIYVLIVLAGIIVFGEIKVNMTSVLIFLLIVINATLLSYLFHFLLGVMAFWVINITSIFWLFRNSINFLGGGWMPISFFPSQVTKFLKTSPFYLALGFPAEFFQGRVSVEVAFWLICAQLGWIVLLFFIVRPLWLKGVKNYEAVGN